MMMNNKISIWCFLFINYCVCLSLFGADNDKSAAPLPDPRMSVSYIVNSVDSQPEPRLAELTSNIHIQPQSDATEADLLALNEDDYWEVALLGAIIAATR